MPLLLVVATGWWGAGGVTLVAPDDSTVSAPGRVDGGSEILSIGTSATGTIAELLVKTGDRVQAGRRLVRVECGDLEREVEARKSDLAMAEAILARVVHGPRPEEVNIAIANVNLAEARSQEAERAFARILQLHEGFTVTRAQIDLAERDARIAAAQLDEVRAKLALFRAGSREEDIGEARFRRDAAKRRVDEAAERLGYCSVDAPIGGIVLSTNVSPGQLVSTSAPVALLTMVDDTRRRVLAFVDERDVSKLCARQPARIAADGVAGLQVDGVVETVGIAVGENPFANNASRQFRQVILSVPDDQPRMPIGLRVTVHFSPCPASGREQENAVAVSFL